MATLIIDDDKFPVWQTKINALMTDFNTVDFSDMTSIFQINGDEATPVVRTYYGEMRFSPDFGDSTYASIKGKTGADVLLDEMSIEFEVMRSGTAANAITLRFDQNIGFFNDLSLIPDNDTHNFNIAKGIADLSGAHNTVFMAYDAETHGNYNAVFGEGDTNVTGDGNFAFGAIHEITGSYSSISGGHTNIVSVHYGVVGGGQTNSITSGNHSTIAGGYLNVIASSLGTIGGGSYNSIEAEGGTISGGVSTDAGTTYNRVVGKYGYIGGGVANIVGNTPNINHATQGVYSFIGGGQGNTTSGAHSAIVCGKDNEVIRDNTFGNECEYSAVVSGEGNQIVGHSNGFIGGGITNSISASAPATLTKASAICGGWNNSITHNYSVICGGAGNSITADSSWVGGGGTNTVSSTFSGIATGTLNTVSGSQSFMGGGQSNDMSGDYSFLGSGLNNDNSGTSSVLVSGEDNTVNGLYNNVLGGYSNTISPGAQWSSIIGGSTNTLSGFLGFIGGGANHTSTATGGFIGGGDTNTVGGSYSTVPGGTQNEASGSYSFAQGTRSKAELSGQFVISDSNFDDWSNTVDTTRVWVADQFNARFEGGFYLITGYDGSGVPTSGSQLASGSNAWAVLSDKTKKGNFKNVDNIDTINKLRGIELSSFQYNSDIASARDKTYYGFMAQDFHENFDFGDDSDKLSIDTLQYDGVLASAVKGLIETTDNQAKLIEKQQAQIDSLLKALQNK